MRRTVTPHAGGHFVPPASPPPISRSWRRPCLALVAAAAVVASAAPWQARAGGYPAGNTWDEGSWVTFEELTRYFVADDPTHPWRPSPDDLVPTLASEDPTRVTVGPWPTTLHLDVAEGSAVTLELARVGSSLPEVLWVQDAAGAVWIPASARTGRTLRFEELPVLAPGGLDVVLTPTHTPRSRVTATMKVRPLAGDPAPSPYTATAPGRILYPTDDPSIVCEAAEQLGVDVLEIGEGLVVLGTPDDRVGFEWTDASWLTQHCGFDVPFEPDAFARPPEGSQMNQGVVGSEFGRMVDRQAALRTIAVPPRGSAADGTGIVIAVVDTGVDAQHPRLAASVLPGRDFVDDDFDARETKNTLDDDGDGRVDDGYGHGTVIAGVALLVAPRAKVLPVRVLDDEGIGTVSNVARGIRWAADNGAHVINLSLGTRTWSTVLADAVAYALERGTLVVCAAGNDGDRWAVNFPGDVPGVVAVTALGLQGRRAGFANGNRLTTVLAPGVHVIGPYPGNTWAMMTGTSFAAPFASGAAALLRQRTPFVDPAGFRATCAPRGRLDLRSFWR